MHYRFTIHFLGTVLLMLVTLAYLCLLKMTFNLEIDIVKSSTKSLNTQPIDKLFSFNESQQQSINCYIVNFVPPKMFENLNWRISCEYKSCNNFQRGDITRPNCLPPKLFIATNCGKLQKFWKICLKPGAVQITQSAD